MQQQILQTLHASAIGGHSGIQATLQRIRQLFAWPEMKSTVQRFIDQCSICKQAKTERVKYPGLLQPLAVPDSAWQVVSLDFVEGLPRSSGFTTILVVVDKLTKYAHFLPLSHPYTAAQVAQLYFDQVFRLHSMPAALISDRDKVFTSKFWQSLFRLSKTEMRMSTAYHPQTDGQTERVNQCLETYLRCFIGTCPATWSKWLPLAEFWYNTAYHTAIKTSPFQALYGHAPRYLGITAESVPVTDLQLWLQERQLATTVLKQHLHRANNRMKQFADNKRSDRVFQVGDWVYLRLQPYIQTTLAMRANAKLAFRYFGPFQVEQKVGDRSYRLKLPDKSKLHPVFHVSLLRKGIPPEEVHEELPVIDDEHPPRHVPEQVLQRRQVQRRHKTKDQVLIQWSGLPASLATWENLAELKARFPRAPAWGQAAPEGGGNVMGLPTHDASSGPPPRPKRARKDNPCYSPEEWTT
jgi:transposase InsO family protein